MVIGTLHPSCAVAKPKLAVPTWRSPSLHVAGKGGATTVVVGIVAGLSSQDTVAGVAELLVNVVDALDAADDSHAESAHAATSTTSKLFGIVSLIPVEVYDIRSNAVLADTPGWMGVVG